MSSGATLRTNSSAIVWPSTSSMEAACFGSGWTIPAPNRRTSMRSPSPTRHRGATSVMRYCSIVEGANTMSVMRLQSVEGFIAFDLEDCRVNAGGTRLAPDVDEREARLLARAMTYKFAALGLEMGGAKAVV